MHWETLSNGALIAHAEAIFDVFITADQNLLYQQNLSRRKLSILVLPTNKWSEIRLRATEIGAAIKDLKPGTFKAILWR